jgi:phosphoribosyl-ATP pyrophosphohydrolase
VEIVYGGGSIKDNGLSIAEVVRVSDLSLVGMDTPGNPWAAEYQRILARARQPTDSYTSRLLQDANKAAQKLASEAMELGREDILKENIRGEYLDVVYAAMIILARNDVPWREVEQLLWERWK